MYYDHGYLDMFVLEFEHNTIEHRCEYFYSFHVFFRIYLETFANGIGIGNPECLFEQRRVEHHRQTLEVLARF